MTEIRPFKTAASDADLVDLWPVPQSHPLAQGGGGRWLVPGLTAFICPRDHRLLGR